MRSPSFKSLIPAAAVAAILAVAPIQFGSPDTFGFAQAQAITVGAAAANAANTNGGLAALSSTSAHEAIGQGAGNPYDASVTPYPGRGDREVTALNLLVAKGYRDFKTVRANGKNFIVDAVHGGKSLMVTINPDTGQISEGI